MLDAGDLGFGVLVAASGVGLAIGSFLAAPALGKVGLRRNYVGSLVLMGVGWGLPRSRLDLGRRRVRHRRRGGQRVGRRLQPAARAAWRARPYRGRALATIMSSNYAVRRSCDGGSGHAHGLRSPPGCLDGAGVSTCRGAVALVMTRWLPVTQADEQEAAVEASSDAAAHGARERARCGAGAGDRPALRSAPASRHRGASTPGSSASQRCSRRSRSGGPAEARRTSYRRRRVESRIVARRSGRSRSSSPGCAPATAARSPARSRSSRTATRSPTRSCASSIRAPGARTRSASPGRPASASRASIGALVAHVRARGRTVGVVSVDPSSPFTHGALLGDRIRLADHFLDPGRLHPLDGHARAPRRARRGDAPGAARPRRRRARTSSSSRRSARGRARSR